MRTVLVVCLCIIPAALAQQSNAVNKEVAPAAISVGQQPVSPTNSYHRIWAIVPLTGSGTHDDPIRPMFVPAPSTTLASRDGIIAWQHQISDDGTLAIVELVAATPAAFSAILASTDSRVKVFRVGIASRDQIQAAFQQVKASFSFNNFMPLPVR